MGKIIEVNVSYEGTDSYLDIVDMENGEKFLYKNIPNPKEYEDLGLLEIEAEIYNEPGHYYSYLKEYGYKYVTLFKWEE